MVNVGFCGKWIAWMRVCVFLGSMSILVNGNPTEETNIGTGLKQGNYTYAFFVPFSGRRISWFDEECFKYKLNVHDFNI